MRTSFLGLLLLFAQTASASPIVVDANNRVIGFYHGVGGPSNEELGVSQKGYRFSFNRFNGRLSYPQGASRPFFVTPNCTGTAYLKNPGAILSIGIVVPAAYDDQNPQVGTAPLYYVQQAPLPPVQMQMSGSFWRFDGGTLTCITDSPGPLEPVVPLLLNNPSETGIDSGTFPAPLRVISSWLFRDGFEGVLLATHHWASSVA